MPKSTEKAASLRSNVESWQAPKTVLNYGRSRSHPVFVSKKLTIENERIRYQNGKMGMLSVISKDGYALTAAHVLNESKSSSILTSPLETRRLHVNRSKLIRFKDTGQKEEKTAIYL